MKITQRELTTDHFDDPMWAALRNMYMKSKVDIAKAEQRIEELKREMLQEERKLDSAEKLQKGALLVAGQEGWSLELSWDRHR